MNTELQYYIQLIAWAYFWVGNLVLFVYLSNFIGYLFGAYEKFTVPFNWKAGLFLLLYLISIKLK